MALLKLLAAGVSLTVGLFCLLTAGYLLLITAAGFWARKRRVSGTGQNKLSFALLIPAHNEELLIATTVQSAVDLNYPKELFRIFVVADNCEDQTARQAAAAGAQVIERTDAVKRGKGHALVTGLERIFAAWPTVDAVVIIDADTKIDAGFLAAMAESLEGGAVAVQGRYLGSNASDTWRTQLQQLAWSLFNYLRPLGRTTLGCSASLLGNGMCFRAELLRRQSWSAFSITEDIEYGLQLLLTGQRVAFNPQAQVFGQMARTAAQAESQRVRWEQGRLAILRQFAGPLGRRFWQQRDLAALEMLLDLLTPPLAVIVCLTLGASAVALLVSIKLALILTLPLGLLALCLVLGALSIGLSWGLLRSLAYAPIYIGWKLLLYGTQLLRPKRKLEWVRTSRHSS